MIDSLEPMGIYIHIPFCLSKCAYCDFYSQSGADQDTLENYTRSVINELQMCREKSNQPFATVYLGGGTPSLLSPAQIERILTAVYKYYQPWGHPEISMEINPATVNGQEMKALRGLGVNRLSIGIQSFADAELKILGRIHNGSEASAILGDVRQAGFDNFNIDLIYGIPGQTESAWLANLHQALRFEPSHISAYLLQLEPTTPLARKIDVGLFSLLDDESEAALYYLTREFMQENGYEHYEISNFARTDRQCRHNKIYWQGYNYLGAGAGAVSFDGRQRLLNSPSVEKYIAAGMGSGPIGTQVLETMSPEQRVADAIIMGLRLTAGISRGDFKKRFHIDVLQEYQDIISQCQEQGLIELADDHVFLTPKAYFLSNQVFSQFI